MTMWTHDYDKYPELTNVELETLGFSSPHEQITADFTATVVKVHDGDTVTLHVSFRDFNFPLRFLGIDSPELNAGGDVARDWLKGKIEGHEVTVLIDNRNRVGKYGRLLGRILYNGIDVGEEEIYLGLASRFESRMEGELPNVDKQFSMKQWF